MLSQMLLSLNLAVRLRRRPPTAPEPAEAPPAPASVFPPAPPCPRPRRKMTLHIPSLFKLSSTPASESGTATPTDPSDIEDASHNRPFASAPVHAARDGGARPALAPRNVDVGDGQAGDREDASEGKGFLYGNGSPALMGLFRALASGNDDEDTDEESGETSGSRSAPHSPTRANADGGEWIGPIEAVPSSTAGVSAEDPTRTQAGDGGEATTTASDRRVVIPPFYRKASVNQADLSHRLAVLSVNNYSLTDDADADAGIAAGGRGGRGRGRGTSGVSGRGDISVQIPTGADQRDKREAVDARAHEISAILHEDGPEVIEDKLKRDVEDKIGATAQVTGRTSANSPVTSDLLAEDEVTESPTRLQGGLPGDGESSATPPSPVPADEVALTPEEKLAAIIEEFGPISPLMVDSSPERFVAESHGSLFRGVLVVGVIHLTTHRMTFHAMMPPPMSIQNENGYTDGHTTVIHSGPITMRRQHNVAFSRKSRVWLELTGEMLTTYPSADEAGRVRPIRSILLSTIKRLYPLDSDHPCDIRLVYSVNHEHVEAHWTVDTRESALEWHRQLEAALFEHDRAQRYQALLAKRAKLRQLALERGEPLQEDEPTMFGEDGRGWEMLRICIPLDRVVEAMCEDYLQIARIIALEVDIRDPEGKTDDYLQCAQDPDRLFPANNWPGRKNTTVPPPAPPKRSGTIASRFNLGAGHRSPSSQTTPTASEDEHEGSHRSPVQRKPSATRTSFSKPVNPYDDAIDEASEPAAVAAITTALPLVALPPTGGIPAGGCTPADSYVREGDSGGQTTGSFRFGVLNHRVSFNHCFRETLQIVRQEADKRAYKPGVRPPMPVIDIGQFSISELTPSDTKNVGNAPIEIKRREEVNTPKKSKHGFHFFGNLKAAKEADDHDDDTSEDEEPVPTTDQRKRKKRDDHKQRKIAAARAVFGLGTQDPVWIKRCYVSRHIPLRGHIVLTDKYLCFWRKTLSEDTDIKYRFPLVDVKAAVKSQAFRIRFKGLAVQINGQQDLVFEFFDIKARDESMERINAMVEKHANDRSRSSAPTSPISSPNLSATSSDQVGHGNLASIGAAPLASPLSPTYSGSTMIGSDRDVTKPSRKSTNLAAPLVDLRSVQLNFPDEAIAHLPVIVNKSFNDWRRPKARTFALLTIGSRGDVQPYIALALRLMNDGHKVVIVTHDEFKKWIEGYGVEHRQAGGDPAELMKLSVEHKILSPGFFKESLGHFKKWFDDLLNDTWEACKGVDVIVESPSMMAGVHVAEALQIPYFVSGVQGLLGYMIDESQRAFTMPWTRTAAYPQAFMVPAVEMGPGFNYSTYVLFENIMWKATAPQINRWRKKVLHLKSTDMSHMSQTKIPMLYNFSSAVVPKPLDWHDDIAITGYWNLENSDTDWSPPDELEQFMQKARGEGKPLVYIGFGSIVVPHPDELTRNIITAVQKADVRAIVAKGWSSRGQDPSKEGQQIEFPPEVYSLDKVPHGWLFPRIDAALHHGGAGTVGASLRAGIPTLIKPWFGDQYFWAGRVTKLGVGLRVSGIGANDIADALGKATRDVVMREKAAKVGEKIRAEDGVGNAVKYIYANLVRAGTDRRSLQWQR